MTDKEQIWRRIAEMETPVFFITADIMCEGSSELDGLEVFIYWSRGDYHVGAKATGIHIVNPKP